MNVLCDTGNQLNSDEMLGWGKAFVSAGNNFLFLKREEKSILDAFNEKKPDIFITDFNLVNRATKKAIENNKYCKFIIFISNQEQKKQIENNNVFFISQNNIENCLNVIPSCDIFLCLKPQKQKSMICDISYVGDYFYEKVFNKCFEKFYIKCWGNSKWPFVNFIGSIKNDKIKNVICSSKMSFYSDNLNNKNWPLNVYGCKGLIINYKSLWLKNILINNDFYVEKEEDFFNLIESILNKSKNIESNIEENYNHVIKNHLCHNRISNILYNIGYEEESKKCLNAAMEIIQKY